MELGRIQKAWITNLRKNHAKQMIVSLGKGNSRNYKSCCLGELLITECRLNKKRLPFNEDDQLVDKKDTDLLSESYKKYGLRDRRGSLQFIWTFNNIIYNSLSQANDNYVSWLDIADYIEKNAHNVFTESK